MHPQQLPREEASGEAVGGLPHGDHHLRGPPHALPLQRRRRRRRRRPHWQLRFHVALEIDRRGRAKLNLASCRPYYIDLYMQCMDRSIELFALGKA